MPTTISDYVGRKIDLGIFHGAVEEGRVPIRLNLSENEIVTGAQKLAQLVTVLLLTEKGSDPFDPSKGTSFLIDLKLGKFTNDISVKTSFGVASQEIVRQLAIFNSDTAPDDEKLVKMELDRVSLNESSGFIILTVSLTTKAGKDRKVILPIGVPIQ